MEARAVGEEEVKVEKGTQGQEKGTKVAGGAKRNVMQVGVIVEVGASKISCTRGWV